MSKVKKRTKVAGVRNTRKKAKTVRKSRASKAKQVPPAPNFELKELDPYRKCGAGTSVELLYRVTERLEGLTTHHLVFFDRHGWYCEHGRTCPAVGVATKSRRRMKRVS